MEYAVRPFLVALLVAFMNVLFLFQLNIAFLTPKL